MNAMPRKAEYLADTFADPNGTSILIPGLKNFSGLRWSRNGKMRGQRSISVRLTKEQADYYVKEGCNVNIRPPKEPGDQETYALKIIINFKPEGDPYKFLDPTFDVGTETIPPKKWDESMIDGLDSLNIYHAEIIFQKSSKPATDPRDGHEFYPCYLQSAILLYKVDYLASRLAEINKMYGAPQIPDEPEPF
jgi:hypothetical protein